MTEGGDFLRRLNRPVKYHELHKQQGNSHSIIPQLRRVIAASGADIVHTRNWGAFDGILAACTLPGVKVLHGEHGRDISDPDGLIWRRNFLRRVVGFRVHKFIAVSADLERWLTRVVRIPARKILLIPNGVDTVRYQPRRSPDLRMELGIGKEEFVVGSIGRLDPVKNQVGVIESIRVLASRGVRLRFVLVGDGPERPRLEQAVAAAGLQAEVILTGFRRDVDKFYGVFDLFVLNSFAEGMSNTILEAMSCGLPVVCTPQGGNVELVEDGLSGSYVPVGDSEALASRIDAYRLNPGLRASHGTSARRVVETRFSLGAMVARYTELYEGAARHSQPRRG